MTDTETAPVQPLEAEPQTDPALTGPVEAQPSPEAAPAEPKEAEAGAEEPKPWVDVKEVEGLREHVTPLLEDAEKTGYDKRTGEFDQYAQPYLQQHSQRLNDINSGIGRMAKGLESLVKVSKSDSGTVDGEVLTEWYDSHKETFESLLGANDTVQQFHGGKRLLVSIADAAGDQSVAQSFMNRLDMLQNGVPDPNLFHDFLKKISAKSDEAIKEPLRKEITSLKAQVEGLKAQKRPDGPDTTQKGGADGRSDNERLLDDNTPIEEVKEIRARQRLAG